MIAATITQKIAEALKSRDEIRLSTLRMLSSALNYENIAKQHELSEEEEFVVVKREAKKRTDAIESLKSAQNKLSTSSPEHLIKRLQQEEKELAILKEYLPEQLNDNELEKLVSESLTETGVKTIQEMGKVIGMVMAKAKGRADGGKVAVLVKNKLNF